ncbi:HD domain-containing phosphohydrolase [Actinoplanes rectilineatus]|uniref:HD domain-containing phosphohydrolase n=1 Tax=Actinoplanes rectilineatus TaxID=113571 RepID=UPI0005F287C7|nr:HD domain-containing phosphohydrolase [Actinoplanes rectilineatus]
MRTIRVAEVLAALSLTTDLATGMDFEKGLRTCVVATALARGWSADPRVVRAVFETALLRSVGCTSYAPELSELFGDDVAFQAYLKRLDVGDEVVFARQLATFGQWAGTASTGLARTFVDVLPTAGVQAMRNGCETSRALGVEFGLLPESVAALDDVYERWDGLGIPDGRAGTEVSAAARIVHVAEQAVLAHAGGGVSAAIDEVSRRSGGHLDPEMAQVFVAGAASLLAALNGPDSIAAVLQAEPEPHVTVPFGSVPRLAESLARVVDLKSRWLLGHSRHVADLAEAAGRVARLETDELALLRSAALLHDIGRVGIPAGIWDRPGGLSLAESEKIRLHTYWTHRILSRVPALAHLAPIASAHHERGDGHGYHRGDNARALPLPARIIGAADMLAALTEPRAHRPAYPLDEAAALLIRDADDGGVDPESARLVIEAMGVRAPRRLLPAGLSEREVQVLRLAARGLQNRQIGTELSISPRTVGHHLAHIYDKTGRRTRAGIALFGMDHGLLP